MEALALLKFWKSTPNTIAKTACGTTISTTGNFDNSSVSITNSNIPDQTKLGSECFKNNDVSDSEDDEESFFELELRLPDHNLQFEKNESDSQDILKNDSEVHRNSYDSDIDSVNWTPINSLFEKSKPRSPISTLRRSASPKLRVLMFGKLLKSKVHKPKEVGAAGAAVTEIESVCSTYTAPSYFQSQKRQQKRKLFTVKLKMDDASINGKKLTRSNSSRVSTSSSSSSSSSSSPKHLPRQCVDFDGGVSKRFSKDSIQKYFKLIKKPPHAKSLRKANGETVKVMDLFSGSESTATSFPSPSLMCSPKKSCNCKESKRFRVACNHLGKSKSASAMAVGGATSPASRHVVRRSDEGNGIEGAILHCKRSLNSCCKEPYLLSRCASDPSQEKSILMMSK